MRAAKSNRMVELLSTLEGQRKLRQACQSLSSGRGPEAVSITFGTTGEVQKRFRVSLARINPSRRGRQSTR